MHILPLLALMGVRLWEGSSWIDVRRWFCSFTSNNKMSLHLPLLLAAEVESKVICNISSSSTSLRYNFSFEVFWSEISFILAPLIYCLGSEAFLIWMWWFQLLTAHNLFGASLKWSWKMGGVVFSDLMPRSNFDPLLDLEISLTWSFNLDYGSSIYDFGLGISFDKCGARTMGNNSITILRNLCYMFMKMLCASSDHHVGFFGWASYYVWTFPS